MKSTDRGDVTTESLKTWSGHFLAKELWGYSDMDLFTRSDALGDWKTRRRILQPGFDQRHVRGMMSGISCSVNELVNKIESMMEENLDCIDVLPVLQDFGMDLNCRTLFGLSLNMMDNNSSGRWLVDCLDLQVNLFNKYQYDPFLRFRVQFLTALGLNPREQQRRVETQRLRQFTRDLVTNEKKRQLASSRDGSGNDTDTNDEESLLSLMVDASLARQEAQIERDTTVHQFGEDEIMDEIIAFMFAGYDTTSITLAVLLHHLATHPEAQSSLHREIDEVLANAVSRDSQGKNNGSCLDLAQIIQSHPLPYLSACIRESQRIQPVAPVNKRRAHEDIKLPSQHSRGTGAPTVVPKGTVVLIPVHLLQRDAVQYPDPEVFRPERWLEDDESTRTKSKLLKPASIGYFYAFGAGPKMCVGFQLAEKEVKMAALGILAHFHVESTADIKIKDAFVTGPEAVYIRLTKRST